MNENAGKWVEALRSEKFDQTEGALRDGTGFCCLGVACDLYRRETGEGRWVWRPSVEQHVFRLGPNEAADEVLPRPVRDWLGLVDDAGGFGTGERGQRLADLNDAGKSFAAIADVIEDEPGGLFA